MRVHKANGPGKARIRGQGYRGKIRWCELGPEKAGKGDILGTFYFLQKANA